MIFPKIYLNYLTFTGFRDRLVFDEYWYLNGNNRFRFTLETLYKEIIWHL